MKSISMIHFPKTFPVTSHTDFVGPGSTFVAIQGTKLDGVSFTALALERGATTIVVSEQAVLDQELLQAISLKNAHIVRTQNCRRALASLSAQALHHPAQQLKIIGITGTKGKTTTAFLVEHMLKAAGCKTALLSTVYNKIFDQQFPTSLTTQHPDYLHVFFDQCARAGVEYVVMEVAAQAYTLDRVYGLTFDAFVFTNFDQEHAEFYATMDDYFFAKCALLKQTKVGAPVFINADSSWCKKLLEANASFFSFGTDAQYSFKKIRSSANHTSLNLSFFQKSCSVSTALIGDFNCYNVTGAFAVCHQLGIAPATLVHALKTFKDVPGRLEKYQLPNNAFCFIDFAHNPSSYASVLATMRPLTHSLIVVCGAGGDRDRTKRPVMAGLATHYADFVIFTNDNPRTENPQTIINDLIAGIAPENSSKYSVEFDRKKAIEIAYHHSSKGSIILLLGKGPDHYQLIGNEKIYFNEAEIIQNLL